MAQMIEDHYGHITPVKDAERFFTNANVAGHHKDATMTLQRVALPVAALVIATEWPPPQL
ncbi:MAG TPA: hypothetical protein VGL55_12790 [Steroidobacteraceae bacterium]|jgi:glycerol-3-phosphate cytidylyltransferase-like family protein